MKLNKNLIKTLIIVFSILLIVVVVGLIAAYNTPEVQSNKELVYINNEEEYEIGTLTVSNPFVWYPQYDGELNTSSVDKSLYYFCTKLVPEYLKITNVDEYYTKNESAILLDLGIENKSEFESLVNSLKVLKGENLVIEQYSVYEDSVSKDADGINFTVGIQYENNEKLPVRLKVKNKVQEGKSSIKYSAELSDKYNTDREEIVRNTEFDTTRPGKVIE